MPQDFYKEDEAEAILRLATRQNISGGMSRDALLRMAGEVGVSPEAVEAAERQFALDREDLSLAEQFRRKQRADYWEQLGGGLGSIAVCMFIWFLFTRNVFFWPGFVILAAVSANVKSFPEHFMSSGSSYQKSFAKWKAKRLKKLSESQIEE